MQGAERLAAHDIALGAMRRRHGAIGINLHKGVEPGLGLLDAPQRRLDHLDGRKLASGDVARELDRRHAIELRESHAGVIPSSRVWRVRAPATPSRA